MKRRLFDNPGVKVGSAALALLIWFHVATEKIYENTYRVPIVLDNIPQGLVLIDATAQEAKVRVKERGKWLIKLYFDEIKVVVNASEAQVGEFSHRFQPLDVKFSEGPIPQDVEVLSPRTVVFYLDELVRKEVPIVSQVEVAAAGGFLKVGEESISPDKAILIGPKSFVDGITSVKTKPEKINGLKTSLTKIVDLVPPEESTVELLPQKVSFSVDVQRETSRTIDQVPVKLVNVKRGVQARLQQETISLTLGGGEGILSRLVPEDFQVTVDYRRSRRERQEGVKAEIVYPSTVRLIDAHPKRFRIIE